MIHLGDGPHEEGRIQAVGDTCYIELVDGHREGLGVQKESFARERASDQAPALRAASVGSTPDPRDGPSVTWLDSER